MDTSPPVHSSPAPSSQPSIAPDGTVSAALSPPPPSSSPELRDRLLSSIAAFLALGFFLALPFALIAGAEFFMPVSAALVIAIALVPALEWLERRGVPSMPAAGLCVVSFLVLINGALALVIVPATTWFEQLPQRLPKIQTTLSPLIKFYSQLQGFVDRMVTSVAVGTSAQARQVAVQTPHSILDYVSSAPSAAIEIFFAILAIFFMLASWTRLRRETIKSRGSFDSALETARVIQNVVTLTSSYLTTITLINCALGLLVAGALGLIGMPSPLMWGGIVAIANFVPYVGPLVSAVLLGLGGLMTFDNVWMALAPGLLMIVLHNIEANIVTPMILGRRLTLNPLLILLSLGFWQWVWGTPGALLAVPILIIVQTLLKSSQRPEFFRVIWGGSARQADDPATIS